MPTTRQRAAFALASLVISVLMSTGFAIWYTGYQNHKWCDTLTILTQNNPRTSVPPSTPLGVQNLQRNIATYDSLKRLEDKFGCN